MNTTRSPPSQPQQQGDRSTSSNSTTPSNNVASSSSSSTSGFFRQRNASGVWAQSSSALFDRFRRPRTATNGSSATNIREAGNLGSGGVGNATRGTDYSSADSTRQELMGNNTSDSPSRGNRLSQFTSRNGLPRSNSSSQVFLPSTEDNNTTSPPVPPTSRKPGLPSHSSSQSHSNIRIGGSSGNRTSSAMSTNTNETNSGLGFPLLSRTGSSQGNASSGPPTSGGFSRMFRRYSQGAGRNMAAANEAHTIAANSSNNMSNSNSATNLSTITNDADSSSNNRLNVSGNQSSSQRSSVALPASGTMLNVVGDTPSGNSSTNNINSSSNEATRQSNESSSQNNQAHRVRLVPHLEATRSLHFEPIERDLIEGAMAVKIGRFTDRGQGAQGNANESTGASVANGSTVGLSSITASASAVGSTANSTINTPGARGGAIPSATGGAGRVDTGRIAFKSKVVSRGHAEIWSESGGKVFIRDTKSSSGTFLNHIRLSAPNVESKPFQIKDGDVVQLGVDYQGGTEEIYRCVKMRVELNRGWQRGANQFNVNALRQLRALQGSPLPDPATAAQAKAKSDAAVAPAVVPTNRQSLNVTDCCICLFSVTVCQALFIAPCSHVFHYKCIRPLLNMHHPGFSCPLCRTFADLEEDVEEDEAWQQALLKEAGAFDQNEPVGIPTIDASTPMNEEPLPSLLAVAIASSNSSEAEHFVDATAALNSTIPSLNSSHDQTSLLGTGGAGNVSGGSVTTDMSLSAGRRRSSAAESFSASRDSRHTPSSRRSGSSHRDSPIRSTDVHMIKRPDTAVSSSTAVPFGNGDTLAASSHASPRHSSRSRASGMISGYSGIDGEGTPNGEEETQELIFDEGSSAAAAAGSYDQSASGPIDITLGNQPNSASAFSRHLIDGLTASPGLNDSRTPQNELFLSTLAEAPVASRNVYRSSS
ncbi:hypothetical protein L7F22_009608 [Adiantum nelumboides]|nr:hypothetical protein [Adiantum nelumboides]